MSLNLLNEPSNSRSKCSGFIRLKYFWTGGLPTICYSLIVLAISVTTGSHFSYLRKGADSFLTNLSGKV